MQTVAGTEKKVPVEDIIEYCGSKETMTAVVKTRIRTTVRAVSHIYIGDFHARI